MKVFHGTNNQEFIQPRLNKLGLFWVTDNYKVAKSYAQKYYNKGKSYVYHIEISDNILDFKDKNQPLVKEIISKIKNSYLFDIESHWATSAGFGVLESHPFVIDIIKEQSYIGVKVLDTHAAMGHDSIALFSTDFEIIEKELVD